jgi:hypothetical protein
LPGSSRCAVIAPPCDVIAGEGLSLLARRPLYEPLSSSLEDLAARDRIDAPALDAWAARRTSRPVNAAGLPIRFAMPDAGDAKYEQRIHDRGEVSTRSGSWHDFFNALVWTVFPRTKAALNRLHVEEIAAQLPGAPRGTLRDAATQFDESGMIVLGADPELLELLRARRWADLFWHRRKDVKRQLRFFVFGHGLYDALRAPFFGLCARAALVEVEPELLAAAPLAEQLARADDIVAHRFAVRSWYPRPKVFAPVPVLGIPGVCRDSECPAYYEDQRQFRPR